MSGQCFKDDGKLIHDCSPNLGAIFLASIIKETSQVIIPFKLQLIKLKAVSGGLLQKRGRVTLMQQKVWPITHFLLVVVVVVVVTTWPPSPPRCPEQINGS